MRENNRDYESLEEGAVMWDVTWILKDGWDPEMQSCREVHLAEKIPEVEPGGNCMEKRVASFAWTLGCVGKVEETHEKS